MNNLYKSNKNLKKNMNNFFQTYNKIIMTQIFKTLHIFHPKFVHANIPRNNSI